MQLKNEKTSNISKSNVSVYLEVYNEEERIESCLKSFSWADELFVFDKQSTDRTREIAEKYTAEVIAVPYCDASENFIGNISGRGSCEWVLVATASTLIHPDLVDKIVELTLDSSFRYDVIGMPYGMYSFGIKSQNSPWTAVRKHTLMRRTALKLSGELHRELSYEGDKVYDIPFISSDALLYHCTHKDSDDFFSRLMRYNKYESLYDKSTDQKKALRSSFVEILKSIFTVIFRRRSFMLGWDGVALSLAYVSYYIMKFIYVWDSHRDNGNTVYPELRKKIDTLWDHRKGD